MPRTWRSLAMALGDRVRRLAGRPRDPFADSPPGLSLSPSARHFADYPNVPLRLSLARVSPGAFAPWQVEARAKLAELSGYSRAAAPPLALREDTFPLPGGLVRRRVYLRLREGVDVPVHLVTSSEPAAEPRPAMLCLQGTNGGAHLSWGEARIPSDLEPGRGEYAIALQAARRGFLAVAIEASCFGERAERAIRPRSAAPCVDASMHAFLLGRSLMGERCSDVSGVVDWLVARAPDLRIDPARIAIMGHSAGGSVALHAAALDTRISAVLACGCIGFLRDTIARRRDDQGQNVIPGILNWLELSDVVALVAPRPLASVAGESDPIWPADGARAVFDAAAAAYAGLGAQGRLVLRVEPGGHRFRPATSWEALASAGHASELDGASARQ